MTVREEIAAKENLREAIADSASLMEVLRKIGITATKNAGEKLQMVCKDRGISLEHLAPKKYDNIISTCPECGNSFRNKSGGSQAKIWCGRACANIANEKTRDRVSLNAKIAEGLTRTLGAIAVSKGHSKQEISCESCSKLFTVKWSHRRRRFCSRSCVSSVIGKKYGSINGRLSAQKMVRRSKNEILFSEMCAEKWAIVCNEPMFDDWDADVVIPDLKVAVLWNGIWHYKEGIRPGHSLLQVQTRDQIKLKVIERHGYKSYVVKDMGKHNPKFVKEEFDKFVEWCKGLSESCCTLE